MKSWLRLRFQAFAAAFALLRQSRASFLMNLLVLGLTLSLPFAGMTLLQNLKPISSHLSVDAEISVFLKMDTPREEARAVGAAIASLFAEAGCPIALTFVPNDQALAQLKERGAVGDAIDALGANPLPDAYLIKLQGTDHAAAVALAESIMPKLQKLSHVDRVQSDSAWNKRLSSLLALLRLLVIFVALALAAVVAAVSFNTIRLQVMNHQTEITVLRLVGATDAFISRPFRYAGTLLGLGAGGLALGLVAAMLWPLNTALGEIAGVYFQDWQMTPLAWQTALLLLLISAALGWMGAALSVRNHLRQVP